MDFLLGLLGALDQAGVRAVVVGGVAVVLHGHPRLTVDLDLVVDLDPANVSNALEVFARHGLRPRLPVDPEAFADPVTREQWRRERGLVVFSLHDPGNPLREVDVFAEEPLPFEELWAAAETMEISGAAVRVASIDHLVHMKRVAGRPQDIADIAALDALRDQGPDS